MDAKSLAKSKRAHSLHHSKKPHSIQKAKAAAGGSSGDAGGGSKPLGKQAKERARQSGLPSNWDRYEEEFEGSDEQSGDSLSKSSDVALPKSKGADYRHLIAEAQSQYQSNSRLDSDSFLSLEDIFPGNFKIGVGAILSARGEGILSWIGDENFIVEEETAGNSEAAFLSLNLNALADQLELVNLSERLYIEPDLLPPELAEDRNSTSVDKSESDTVRTGATEARGTDFSEENKVAKQKTDILSSGSSVVNQGQDISNQTTSDLNSKADVKISQSTASIPSSFPAPSKKVSTFEAKSAEAELDMLLDSFSETTFLDSAEKFPNAPKAHPQFTKTAPSSSGIKTSAAQLDNFLDDLLEKTSNSNDVPPLSSQSVSKSKVLDDFDSWLDTI